MASSPPAAAAAKICFNPHCKEPRSEPPRFRGWRLRSGDFADLCHSCSSSYNDGNFCDTYHADIAGWRNCETCGKRLHCGCIVSAPGFVLRDAGGVECILCFKKASAMMPERLKEFSLRSWNQMGPTLSGHWRQTPMMWSGNAQSDLQQRLSYELDRPNNSKKLIPGRRYTIVQDKKNEDLPASAGNFVHVLQDRFSNGSGVLDPISSLHTFQRERCADNLQDSGHQTGENDPMSARRMASHPCSTSVSGIDFGSHPNSRLNSQQSSIVKDDPSSPLIGLPASFASSFDVNDPTRDSKQESASLSLAKQLYPNHQNAVDSNEVQVPQIRNGRPRLDAQARSQLLPRYWPRITEQELQQISGDSNSVITPLFEKVLSASDAGRIGRLVLPKKCAEAYFPPISQPEGLPLKVQDAKGKEWLFQFRFWPNNNSRMYVLEGVTPCIQSMQLQAGDTVTFSRIDPEGKLIMGFRKASNVSTEQDFQSLKDGNSLLLLCDAKSRSCSNELAVKPPKGSTDSRNHQAAEEDSGFIQKVGPGGKPLTAPSRRKGSNLGSKTKRLRINKEDAHQLKLTWEEAQELLRPPKTSPNIVVIDGHEIEEYEEAPVLGKPTIFINNEEGERNQWAQCEDCLKWRKIPIDALLPFRWTCADNAWDPERSLCSSAQEVDSEELLPPKAGPSKKAKTKVEPENIELSDGLDTLANLAILGEGESLPSSSQQTTKHPRHRPGCTCIVCIQPPSGKGPKHKQTCTCNVCLTVKRRFRTLMLRREKRQSEKEAEKVENARKQQEVVNEPQEGNDSIFPTDGESNSSPSKQIVADDGILAEDECEKGKQIPSPLKTQIDLNIQPERDEELSPLSSAGSLMRLLREGTS